MIALLLQVALEFRDVTEERGLLPHVAGIRGHAAGWGDVDGDGYADLYVATFHNEGSKANQFFRNRAGKFELDGQEALRISTRSTASLFADFDNDGDLDLYVTSMPTTGIVPCALFRNDGGGAFVDVSKDNGACPPDLAGRSAAALDFDGDGLLDLLVADDPLPGYKGRQSSRLFRNVGKLAFEDATEAAGLPKGVPALGVAAADLDLDGRPDVFLASRNGSNRLFLNGPGGRFREVSRETFAWVFPEGDDSTAGVCFGDVDGDGKPDLVVGHHFKRPWMKPVAVRLYLNRGEGKFEDATDAAGLVPLPMKAPHVELQDFDNDGRLDLLTSIVKFADGKAHPVIFRNLGGKFRCDALAVNDFPTAEDRGIGQSGKLFEKVLREKKILYGAPMPSADFDNDGRLDLFLCSGWLEAPSMLLRNETAGGHWLQIDLECGGKVNRQGIGARIVLSHDAKPVGSREVAVGFGYASGQPATAHFGLGTHESVDVEVILPHGAGTILRKGVKADQRLKVTP